MAIDYEKLMSLETKNQEFSYSDKETMLYGLGVGFGKDPLNDNELKFVYEKDLKTVPSMATVFHGVQVTYVKVELIIYLCFMANKD